MRLAYLSPLPPEATGIADYSAAILPELLGREGTEVEVFTSELGRDGLPEVTTRLYRELPERHRQIPFDVAIHQMGNSPFHLEIRDLAFELPGLVVLHEFVLHHLVRAATLAKGDRQGYVEEMRYAYGATGETVARLALDPEFPIDLFAYPLFERTVDRARAVLVHNETTRQRVLRSRPETLIEVVPSALDLDRIQSGREPEQARKRFGFGPEHLLLGAFGLATPAKRLEPVVRAFRRLARHHENARLLIVGEVSPHYDLERLLLSLLGERDEDAGRRLRERVVVTGRLAESEFLDLMAAVDIGVNLRHPTAGETSYTLLWLLALGKPVLVSTPGPAAELAGTVPAPVGGDEELFLVEAMELLARETETRALLGAEGRRAIEERHRPAIAVDGYLDLARRAMAAAVYRAAPPLLAFPADDQETVVLAQVAAALSDLGVGERDDSILKTVAERLEEIGWRAGPGDSPKSSGPGSAAR